MLSRKTLSNRGLAIFAALCLTALVAVPRASVAQAAATKAATAKDYTTADVVFMQGMIGHHAQAVVMGKMAVSHGASANVALFCKKVIISQRDVQQRREQAALHGRVGRWDKPEVPRR